MQGEIALELRKRQWKSWRLFDDMRFGHQRRSPVSGGPWKTRRCQLSRMRRIGQSDLREDWLWKAVCKVLQSHTCWKVVQVAEDDLGLLLARRGGHLTSGCHGGLPENSWSRRWARRHLERRIQCVN